MKLPLSWLKEFIPDLPHAAELEPLFAQLGLPLEEITTAPSVPEGVILVEVKTVERIEGTKLTKIVFHAGEQYGLQTIASGASNAARLQAGDLLALVSPGTTLGGVTYGERELQGVVSWGMAASEKELGIGEQNNGLMVIAPQEAPAGTPLRDLWPEDLVLDVEVTPNRADVLSVLGVARDIAAFLDLSLVLPSKTLSASFMPPVSDSLEGLSAPLLPANPVTLKRDPTALPRLGCDMLVSGKVTGVRNRPSPLWLQRRLTLCGVRPRDLIVDVGNYVMLECGQPTALYDAREVSGLALTIGGKNEMLDLAGQTHALSSEDLLVTDVATGEVLGLAGVIGAQRGHVVADTSDVIIEAAHFDPVMVRLSSGRVGLKTEAAYRFERGTDPTLPPRAAARIGELLGQFGGTLEGLQMAGKAPEPISISVSAEKVRGLLGMHIETARMVTLLEKLGCVVTPDAEDTFAVQPPAWRIDMHLWQDVAEEIARMHGFSQLPETLPRLHIHPSNHGASRESTARSRLRQLLAGRGFQEVVTYTFSHEKEADQYGTPELVVKLRKPMGAERTGLRTALYPSLVMAAGTAARAWLFEIGRIFPESGETERLCLLMRGDLAVGSHERGVAGGFSVFKGQLEAWAASEGAALQILPCLPEEAPKALHPTRAGWVSWNGEVVGWMGSLHPEIAALSGVKGETFIAEISLPLPVRRWTFTDPRRAPVALRDLAVVAPEGVSYGEVAAVLREAGGELLESLEPFDVYKGEQIGAGQRSVAVRMTYRGEKTLTEADIDPVFAAQIEAIRVAGWSIRER